MAYNRLPHMGAASDVHFFYVTTYYNSEDKSISFFFMYCNSMLNLYLLSLMIQVLEFYVDLKHYKKFANMIQLYILHHYSYYMIWMGYGSINIKITCKNDVHEYVDINFLIYFRFSRVSMI